jgi:uncharacterized protein YjiS (DUF1127 family)
MRITHEMYHSVSPSAPDMPEVKVERRSMGLQAAYYPSLSGRLGTSDLQVAPYATGAAAAVRRPLPQSKFRQNAVRGPIARAISRIGACVLEGFAAYGEAMYPNFADPDERVDYQNTEADAQPRSEAQNEHEDGGQLLPKTGSPLGSSPLGQEYWHTQGGAPHQPSRLDHFPVARLWSWMHQEWEMDRTIGALRTLDDRTLKDLGLYRCQTESVVRNAYRYE